MDWLFGVKKESTPDISTLTSILNEEIKGNQGQTVQAHRFDSSALEKAAKAAKELEKSPHAQMIFELTKEQEHSKQMENMRIMKEREVQVEMWKAEQIKVAAEEKKKQAEYQDQLARKRHNDQLQEQARLNDEILRKQEESVAKQEATRLKALEKEFKMREDIEIKKVESQVRAQAISDRENREINLEKIMATAAEDRKTKLESIHSQAEESRKTLLESIKTTSSVVGLGMQSFLNDRTKVATFVAGFSALAVGVYTAKYGLGVTARYVESRISKPSLIRETSRFTATDALRHPIKTFKRYSTKAQDAMKGIVFEPKLEEQLRDIAIATRFTKANKGVYRNFLFYGPPGTGKTMFAKSLAHHSGMDYAIMTGGDVAPLGSTGVTAIHKVFDWAKTSRRGLLLFIDEADAFLKKRNMESINEDLRSALNGFLYHTGDQSQKFMLVLASNLPEHLDTAMINRIDRSVEFDVPSLEERERLVRLYFDLYVLEPLAKGSKRLKVAPFDFGKKCSEIAKMTEGFSGREIAKLGVCWQAEALASRDGVLTEEVFDRAVQFAIKEYRKSFRRSTSKMVEDGECLKDSA